MLPPIPYTRKNTIHDTSFAATIPLPSANKIINARPDPVLPPQPELNPGQTPQPILILESHLIPQSILIPSTILIPLSLLTPSPFFKSPSREDEALHLNSTFATAKIKPAAHLIPGRFAPLPHPGPSGRAARRRDRGSSPR